MEVLYNHALDDRSEQVDRSDIDACNCERQLSEWYRSMHETEQKIRAFVDSYRFVGRAEDEWLDRAGGKLAFLRIGKRWVEERMLGLGFEPPYPQQDGRNQTIRGLEKRNKKLKQILREHGIEAVDV